MADINIHRVISIEVERKHVPVDDDIKEEYWVNNITIITDKGKELITLFCDKPITIEVKDDNATQNN